MGFGGSAYTVSPEKTRKGRRKTPTYLKFVTFCVYLQQCLDLFIMCCNIGVFYYLVLPLG